ncbi:MAG: hypothetical protein FJX57_10205, partial [Alphaproteobacteria bacterium]|nr:hypothetical protein [Alphaproteobacteria bacterium]
MEPSSVKRLTQGDRLGRVATQSSASKRRRVTPAPLSPAWRSTSHAIPNRLPGSCDPSLKRESEMTDKLPAVAFIGVGTMAEAMVDKAIAGGWPRDRLILTHRRAERRQALAKRFGGSIEEDNLAAAKRADWIVIAVRPQECGDMIASLTPGLRPGQSLLSICAGLTIDWLQARLPQGMRVIRVTPPPTAWVGA